MVDWTATYESEDAASQAAEDFDAEDFSDTLVETLNADPVFIEADITVACRSAEDSGAVAAVYYPLHSQKKICATTCIVVLFRADGSTKRGPHP